MSYQLILLSIFVFISLPPNGQSNGENILPDILNTGYKILKNLENRSHVFEQIDSLWEKLIPDSSLKELNPQKLKEPFGVPGYIPSECLSVRGLESLENFLSHNHKLRNVSGVCGQRIVENINLIESFTEQIDSINKHLLDIELGYQNLKGENASTVVDDFDMADRLYEFISESYGDTATRFFHQIAGSRATELGSTRPIFTTFSVGGEVYHAYCIIAMHLLKGYATEIYHYYDSPRTPHRARKIELVQTKFLMHTHRIAKIALAVIKDASRDVTLGEPTESTSAIDNYIQLKWFVGQIIVNEANFHPSGMCNAQCDYYEEAKFFKYGSFPSASRDVCQGTMSHCNDQLLGWVCPANATSSRRYAGIKRHKKTRLSSLGDTSNCFNGDEKSTYAKYNIISSYFTKCVVCTCLCDDHENPETIRTFSLRKVKTNVAENMVITGLKLTELNGTIYIQIQEGKLKNFNQVESARWAPVEAFDEIYEESSEENSFTLRFPDRRAVNLDTISTQDEFVVKHVESDYVYSPYSSLGPYVLTGVKFGTCEGQLNFGIRLTAWNATAQKLEVPESDNWIFKDSSARTKIELKNSDIPTKTKENVEVEGPSYVEFQATDNVKDFGQTTVPFLDARAVVTEPPMPLSGAGLFYKGKPGYGGIIGLKLVSLDFSQFMVTKLRDEDD